jgi:hypothetical protein
MPHPRIEFTPAALENMRYRVEETDESLQSIADSHSIHRSTLYTRIAEHGWVRRRRAKRDVPPGGDLHEAADAALRAEAAARVAKRLRASAPTGAQPAGAEPAKPASNAEPAKPASNAERLERLLVEQLSAFETERLKLGSRSIAKATRLTRLLERLTEALFKVQRLHAAEAIHAGPNDYDDWPVDIDAFREELARRIDVFVRERTGAGVPEREPDPDAAPGA